LSIAAETKQDLDINPVVGGSYWLAVAELAPPGTSLCTPASKQKSYPLIWIAFTLNHR